jgi:FkbM family methyltransferase
MTPPVLLILFNRPELTRRVFDRIREARPPVLFVHGDGPRPDRPDDIERCRAARDVVASVDWPCRIERLFRDQNLGCGRAVAGALEWYFGQVEEGVVLEDDCLPLPAFFGYAAEMLSRYRTVEDVWHVSAMGPLPPRQADAPAVYLAPFPFIWGWASWARAWKHYRKDLPDPTSLRKTVARVFPASVDRRYWYDKFAQTREGRIRTWDYQWVHSLWAGNALAVTPTFSLVENLGTDAGATHPSHGRTLTFAPWYPHETWPKSVPEITVPRDEFLARLNRDLFRTPEVAPAPAVIAGFQNINRAIRRRSRELVVPAMAKLAGCNRSENGRVILRSLAWQLVPPLMRRLIRPSKPTPAPGPTAAELAMDRFYASLLKPGARCFDVGANIGDRVASFRRLGYDVIAVEPQRKCQELLAARFAHDTRVTLIHAALGEKPGHGRLMVSNADVLSTMSTDFIEATTRSGRFANYAWNQVEEVPMLTVDQLIERHGAPDFIKIDVEGFEAQVVRGLSRPVPLIAIEWTPELTGNALACVDHLQQLGSLTFNLSWGESMRLSQSEWIPRSSLEEFLAVFRHETYLFGDIYIRMSAA